ncbi:hypothetical protein C8A05DRAFT_19121 [Staphylotrichum tortipilum]|uniref:Uncharacterized protein n=1 Tax=Staphylotrichum tortipilum TaxID=2831512 RepID=A0AAN6MDX2_9PEZI|nr:hypothetical protein C8A05DRAFT_19121 [Staphylotrichum longicolle]
MGASRAWSFALNTISLLSLLTGIYLALRFRNKPLLAWDVPLHLSYQKIGVVEHSHRLARYDADLWNHVVQLCGGVTAALTLVAFQHYRNGQTTRSPIPRRLAKSFSFSSNLNLGTFLLWTTSGAGIFSRLLGMHPGTWTTTSPIRAVSTAAITAELTRVPAATPWDMSSVMLRSSFERVVSQKVYGLEVTHRYLSRHLREGEGVRVGRTVYPSIRTHGVGVAPVPWERKGYSVSLDQGRVLAYEPIVAATNVTVQCSDSSEDWAWDHQVHEFAPTGEPGQPNTVTHRFHLWPKNDWHTRGPNHTATNIDGDKGFNLETWQALKKGGDKPQHADNMEIHQIFLFTNVGPINRLPKVILIDCLFGGADVIRQVTMTSPLEPVSIGDVTDTKDTLNTEDLYPAASAIEKALGRDGGAMVAGMAAAGMTSIEMWDLLHGRTLELNELIEHILVDTAQAYFSLVRQWKEEAQFFSWPREVPAGQLTAATTLIGHGSTLGVGAIVVLGLLALFPLTALTELSQVAMLGYRQGQFRKTFELKDGVIKRKSE